MSLTEGSADMSIPSTVLAAGIAALRPSSMVSVASPIEISIKECSRFLMAKVFV